MKSSKLILGCLATVGLTVGAVSAQAEVDRDAIAERLKPVGQLCLQGEDCGTAAAAESSNGNGDGGVDGAGIYNQVCMACHETGAAGAPRRGEEGEWAERIDQGWETLLDHSINGFNAMPARGGNPNLSDEEVAAATAHLLEPVMDVPEVGGDEASAEDTATDEAVTEEGPVEEEAEAAAVATEDAPADEEAATEDEASGDEAAASDSDIDGEAIYNQACMACHMTGAAGAPRRGEAGEWEGRIDQDTETLYDHAINGIGAMPPKGGHTNLSDDEVRAAVDFLLEPIQ